ncbi:MAG: aldehyde ferredoxin oxidoreductase N-terminal domain-containing protein [Acidobacteriota bacterium]
MTYGYTGKILRVDLTRKSIGTLDTEKYDEYGGGHGIGSAIFWDLAGDQLPFGALDPRNVLTVIAGPFSGVVVPSAAGRCEVQGLGPQGYPVEWFTRSNFGGRFSTQLKYAGWDGIVIEGASEEPVWINIINDKVKIETAGSLWGLDVMEAQEEIWRRVTPEARYGEWLDIGDQYTTQKPAVLCIGPAGENQVRIASLIHDAGNGAGQGGFGAVFGSKQLKAISVIGTGSVTVADPRRLMDARLWYRQYQYNVENPRMEKSPDAFVFSPVNDNPADDNFLNKQPPFEPARAQACVGCPKACRMRLAGGISNESSCEDTIWAIGIEQTRKDREIACDLVQHYGINAFQMRPILSYIQALDEEGILGPGKMIESDLPMQLFGKVEFIHALVRKISNREGIGDALSGGIARAAEAWGRYKQDTDSGLLSLPNWGYFQHYDPRLEVEWSYGSILGERDINEHSFNMAIHHMPGLTKSVDRDPVVSAEKAVDILSRAVAPYDGDPYMFDYSEGPTGIYSDHRVKTIAWHRHYTRFWIQSVLFCDWVWPRFFTPNSPDKSGPTPEGEPRFFNAVTGKNISFVDGIEIGRKIWNLDRSIWVMQGRHRDMEELAGYVYNVPTEEPYYLPAYENGAWTYSPCVGRVLNKDRFEEWKTKFYAFEGWNIDNGWPKRNTLESMGLGKVADTLHSRNRIG